MDSGLVSTSVPHLTTALPLVLSARFTSSVTSLPPPSSPYPEAPQTLLSFPCPEMERNLQNKQKKTSYNHIQLPICPFWFLVLFSSFLNPSIAQGNGMFSVCAGTGVGRRKPEELFIRTKMYFKKPFSPEDNSYWKT